VLGTTNDNEWRRLATQVIDRTDLADDERYASNAGRCSHRGEIDAAISAWTAGHSLDAVQKAADAAGIGNARYNTVHDVLGHPQLADRHRWRDVGSPVGPLAQLLAPVDSAGWPQRTDPIPALGEHTESVLGELGYDAAEIGDLRSGNVI
jgi:crotonobetainyl-CoA:carnitine CoA-transferase CaiB-like acyl-CoA transferase